MLLPFEGKQPSLAPDVFVAEGAKIVGDVTIGAGSTYLVQCSVAWRFSTNRHRRAL